MPWSPAATRLGPDLCTRAPTSFFMTGIAERRKDYALLADMPRTLVQLHVAGFAVGHMPTFAVAAPWPPRVGCWGLLPCLLAALRTTQSSCHTPLAGVAKSESWSCSQALPALHWHSPHISPFLWSCARPPSPLPCFPLWLTAAHGAVVRGPLPGAGGGDCHQPCP